MVLAGPGSGKTSVIVERTAYMTGEGEIPASSVLVVTFSRAAAKEMRERFLKFTGQTSTAVTFGTFHGVFYGILKQAYGLGAGNILSEEEKYDILKRNDSGIWSGTGSGGRFPGGCGKGNQRGKRGRISWITIILPAARMRYSARFIMGIRRLCAREENWISMTCFFAAMNFCQEKRYSGGMAKQIPIHYGR